MDVQKFSLKELRARKGWTQQEVAKRLGVSTQTYNAWEKDVSGVAVSKVLALAELFDVSIDQIFLTSKRQIRECQYQAK